MWCILHDIHFPSGNIISFCCFRCFSECCPPCWTLSDLCHWSFRDFPTVTQPIGKIGSTTMATQLLTLRCLHTLLCILWPLCKRLLIWHPSPPSTSPAGPTGPCPCCSSPPPSPPRSSSPSRWTRGETRVRRASSRSPPSAPPSRAPSRTPGNIAAATSDQMSVFYFEHICATTRLIKFKKYSIVNRPWPHSWISSLPDSRAFHLWWDLSLRWTCSAGWWLRSRCSCLLIDYQMLHNHPHSHQLHQVCRERTNDRRHAKQAALLQTLPTQRQVSPYPILLTFVASNTNLAKKC